MGESSNQGGAAESAAEWLIKRSVIDPRRVRPGEVLECLADTGEAFLLWERRAPYHEDCWLWQTGVGGYRLSASRSERPERAPLPLVPLVYLPNPVDGLWHRGGEAGSGLTRRALAGVRSWKCVVLSAPRDQENEWRRWLFDAVVPPLAIADFRGSWQAWLAIDGKVGELSPPAWVAELAGCFGADLEGVSPLQVAMVPAGEGDGIEVPRLLWLRWPHRDPGAIDQLPLRRA